LDVYQKAKSFNKEITGLLVNGNFDSVTNNQLRRAPFSIMLNIAEGSSRFSNKDLRNYLVTDKQIKYELKHLLGKHKTRNKPGFVLLFS